MYRLDQESIRLGRDRSNFIVLESRAVSRHHAEILMEHGQFFVRDLKSNNGTKLSDRLLPPEEKTLLRDGDVLTIDAYEIGFQLPTGVQAQNIYEVTDSDLLEIKMVKKLLRALDKDSAPSLEILEGPHSGKRFVFEGKTQDVTIGRDPACEFHIDSDVMSRRHARIEKRFDTVSLHDLESKNGTFVNRQKVKEKRLQDGDILHLGTLALSFRNPQDLALQLDPPKLKVEAQVKEEPAATEEEPGQGTPEAISDEPASRSSHRREGSDLPPHAAQSEMPSPVESEGGTGFKLSPTEIITLLLGLVLLVGSIWGIAQLLK